MKQFLYNRLWVNNSSLVQLLGLCPVLAITNNVVNSIGLGITTTVVLTCTNTIISLLKKWIPKDIRIPIYMVIIASFVSSIEMLIHSYYFHLYKSLGIFIPLIVTNCIILGRADFIAYRSSVLISFFDGIFIGLGSTLAMFCVGAVREILSTGTLFHELNKLLFMSEHSFFLPLIDQNFTILLFTLPPGGFMILGFIIAFKNFIDIYFKDYILSNISACSCFKFKKK